MTTNSNIVLQRENAPRKYRHWTVDYDKSNHLQSYRQLKSSAKYIFSKFKPENLQSKQNSSKNKLTDSIGQIQNQEIASSSEPTITTTFGIKGEIYRIHQDYQLDCYDWFPPNDQKIQSNISLEDKSLYLINSLASICDQTNKTVPTYPLKYDRDHSNLCTCLDLYPKGEKLIDFKGHCKIKNDSFGWKSDIDYVPYMVDSSKFFVVFDKTNSILHIFDYSSFKLVKSYDDIKVTNSHPVFDLKDTIFMYVPKSISEIEKRNLTPLNLSSKKTLLNKLIKTFSNTAMDSMFMFSEVTQQKIKRILEERKKSEAANGEETINKDISTAIEIDNGYNEKLKDNYRDIFTELYNTISKNSDYVCAIDLKTKKTMFQLSVSSGCSKISISPFDLQFLIASNRGDELFLWDYTKAYDSIVLMDKYTRGKTSAIIEQIEWGTGNGSILCLSRQNGSLHYFINESLRNYEDMSIRKSEKRKNSSGGGITISNTGAEIIGGNSWCLSNLKLKSFKVVRPLFIKDFVIAIDENDNLLTIDMEVGGIDGYFKIDDSKPQSSTATVAANTIPSKTTTSNITDTTATNSTVNGDTSNNAPLIPKVTARLLNSEIEVETCKPFLPAYNNKKYKFCEIEIRDCNADVFDHLDTCVDITKEYNIAGTLFERKMNTKKEAQQRQRKKQEAVMQNGSGCPTHTDIPSQPATV